MNKNIKFIFSILFILSILIISIFIFKLNNDSFNNKFNEECFIEYDYNDKVKIISPTLEHIEDYFYCKYEYENKEYRELEINDFLDYPKNLYVEFINYYGEVLDKVLIENFMIIDHKISNRFPHKKSLQNHDPGFFHWHGDISLNPKSNF